MSWQASAWALRTRVGDPVLKILLLAIANYAQPDGSTFAKVKTLAFDSEVSERTIQRSLTKLAELGLIKITPRFNKDGRQLSSRLVLMMPELELATEPASAASLLAKLRPDRGEGVNLSPTPAAGGEADEIGGGRVTQLCRGEGDNKVSPPESFERFNELSSKKESKCPKLSLGAEPDVAIEAELVSPKEQAEQFFAKQFWPNYPKRFGTNPKEPARKKIVALILKGEKPEEILNGLRQLYSGLKRSGKLGTEFVPMAVTWINRRSWKDDPLPAGNGRPLRDRSFFEIAEDIAEDLLNGNNGERTDHDGQC